MSLRICFMILVICFNSYASDLCRYIFDKIYLFNTLQITTDDNKVIIVKINKDNPISHTIHYNDNEHLFFSDAKSFLKTSHNQEIRLEQCLEGKTDSMIVYRDVSIKGIGSVIFDKINHVDFFSENLLPN